MAALQQLQHRALLQRKIPAAAALPTPLCNNPVRNAIHVSSSFSSSHFRLREARGESSRVFATQVSSANPASVDDLEEVNPDTFWPYIEAASEDLVVVDFYHVNCIKCKAMYPELVELAEESADKQIKIVKFNCKKETKEFVTGLAIKMSPTFFLYRNKVKVAELVGAKIEKLRALINAQQTEAGRPLLK